MMRVKTTWYLSELDTAVSNHVHEFVHDTFKETEVVLSERWTTLQATGSITCALQPEALDFVADADISLDNLYNYCLYRREQN